MGLTLIGRFAAVGLPEEVEVVRHFVRFLRRPEDGWVPGPADDVDVRAYLLVQRAQGLAAPELGRRLAALRRFYGWAAAEGAVERDPFVTFQLDRPVLSPEQVRRREERLSGDPQQRELARLRALHHLAEELNRRSDAAAALGAALDALGSVLELPSGWAFVLADSGLASGGTAPPHGFVTASAARLPPGLEADARRHLDSPPACYCQELFRAGRLTRAVNVVECTRLRTAAREAGDTRGLLFHATLPLVVGDRPLGIVNLATAEWQLLAAADLELLSAAGPLLGSALERARLYDEAEGRRRELEDEIEMARVVQSHLLPRLPAIPGFEVASEWRAARTVAGDFYDVFPIPGGRYALAIADVSGKGPPAALYMAMARSLLRAAAEHGDGPSAALVAVNAALREQSTARLFVTVFLAFLDPARRVVHWASAGHNPSLLRRRGASRVEALPLGGMALGLRAHDLGLADRVLVLDPGDALLLHTDGVGDAEDPDGAMYGAERLEAAVGAAPAGAHALVSHVLGDLEAFTSGAAQADDVTLLALVAKDD
ncbi:MAG TPA: SpoIIE family protein phosphatase [Vicinamibacteria bacterium]|nr:SpoIIE family protein phosphatase [Vicinamibacteria bacterium]